MCAAPRCAPPRVGRSARSAARRRAKGAGRRAGSAPSHPQSHPRRACARAGPSLCLGTMEMGSALDARASMRLLDEAWEGGISFFDSAEMYPVPQEASSAGRSEEIVGEWLRLRGRPRDAVRLSTKVCGPGDMEWIRGGPTRLDAKAIESALEGSLRRMQVDYVDYLHLHWPDRYVPMFGEVRAPSAASDARCAAPVTSCRSDMTYDGGMRPPPS